MKKLISLALAFIMCFSVCSVSVFATEDVTTEVETEETTHEVTSVELHNVKYYAAVKTAEEIADAAFFVDFVAYFDNGTSVAYNSKEGWAGEIITAEVSWYIQPETDENFDDQQSLYIVINGEEYWAGYTHVEVDQCKAIFRSVVTWDWITPEVIDTAGVLAGIALVMYTAFQWITGSVIFNLIAGIFLSRIV